jgi:hypothetical protein
MKLHRTHVKDLSNLLIMSSLYAIGWDSGHQQHARPKSTKFVDADG